MFIPMFITLSNITTIYKNKGSRLDLENDRGIFIISTIKKILNKLIYNNYYNDIDENMADSNRGKEIQKHKEPQDDNIWNHEFNYKGR